MYTELIFGAELKSDTPIEIIESLKYMLGELENKPKDFPTCNNRFEHLFGCSSYYFGVNKPITKMWYDLISKSYHISTRSNLKNYDSEIETFLEWIKPYIESGSGINELYAIVIYEDAEIHTLYYLED